MRRGLAFAILIPLCAQPLPPWINSHLPHSDVAAVQKAERGLALLQRGSPKPIELTFTEVEVNAYAREALKANAGCGVSNPLVKLLAKNYASVYFEVDPRQFLDWQPRWRGRAGRVLKLLPVGRKTILVEFRISTESRRLQVSVEKARINGIYVAPALVNLGLRFFRTWKNGRLNVVDGMPLPWNLHHVTISQGAVLLGT